MYRQFWTLATAEDGDCYVCGQTATGWSSMNIWGGVVDFPSCDCCHKETDTKMADSVPRKKEPENAGEDEGLQAETR